MFTLDEVDPSIVYAMLKGEPGTRKSTQALSFPTPQYWFDWDGHMDSIIYPMQNWGMNPKEIHGDTYYDWDSARIKLEAFKLTCPYKTIVLDSITTAADSSIRQTLRTKGDGKGKRVGGILVPGLDEFNGESGALNELLSLTKEVRKIQGVNIVLIAHVIQADYRDTTTGLTHICRQIVTAGKKIAPKIPAYCSEVYHFNMMNTTTGGDDMKASTSKDYGLYTVHTGDDFARSALNLPERIVFGDKPLYETFMKSAIEKLKSKQNIVPFKKPVSF